MQQKYRYGQLDNSETGWSYRPHMYSVIYVSWKKCQNHLIAVLSPICKEVMICTLSTWLAPPTLYFVAHCYLSVGSTPALNTTQTPSLLAQTGALGLQMSAVCPSFRLAQTCLALFFHFSGFLELTRVHILSLLRSDIMFKVKSEPLNAWSCHVSVETRDIGRPMHSPVSRPGLTQFR